jgi:DNA-directed RNA polymerase subunit RPC12/RpoP
MAKFRYITNRTLTNKAGKESGKIRVVVPINCNTAYVEYVCPECGHCAKVTQTWQRPFAVKCEKCSFLMRVPSMKAEIKKKGKI